MHIIGGTIRREQKTFARSWVTREDLNTQLQEEVDQYKLATDSVVEERKLSGTVLYKEEGLIRVAVIMTMIKESNVKEIHTHQVLGFVSVVIQQAEWSCIKMGNGEHYVGIFGRP